MGDGDACCDMCALGCDVRVSEEDLEEGVVGLQLRQFEVVLQGTLLEGSLMLRTAKAESDQALSGGGVKLLGRIKEDDVFVLVVDDVFQQDADVDCVVGCVREEGEVRM
jgi:hypothetical protein